MRRSLLPILSIFFASLLAMPAIAAPSPTPDAPPDASLGLTDALDLTGGAPSLQNLDASLDALFRVDLASDTPPGEGITRRVYRRVYTRYYAPPQHVVVVQRPTTIVTHSSDPPIYARPPQRAGISAGLRFSTVSLGDTSLQYETFEGATLVGVGGYLRGMFDPHWGLEIGVDILGADETAYSQFAVPVMAGLVASLFPDSFVNVYGIAGGGLIFNNIEYYGGNVGSPGVDESFIQLTGQLGAGVELNVGPFQITSDLRWLFMQARPERDLNTLRAAPLPTTQTVAAAPSSNISDVTNALQFTLGLGGSF
jgi:hypothetical protein